MSTPIPVVLFAYARPGHMSRTLHCLRENQVGLLYAFSDGPRNPDEESLVAQVREILRAINWCEVILCEREVNLGLGRSIRAGVTSVLGQHDACIVFEDDLICVPGTYEYVATALRRYQDDERVMSVTGWNHPRVIPSDVGDRPYFDGRSESLVWGTWSRAWRGMERTAKSLMRECQRKGIDVYRYGADLPKMAKAEMRINIRAVRFFYHHILHGGLCLRPRWSMVDHIGFDDRGTHTRTEKWYKNPPLASHPPIPDRWPEPVENLRCPLLWQQVCGSHPTIFEQLYRLVRRAASRIVRTLVSKAGDDRT